MSSQPSPFSPEELSQFATVDTPAAAETSAPLINPDEIKLLAQQQKDVANDLNYIKGQLSQRTAYQPPAAEQPQAPKMPDTLPIVFDKDNRAVVRTEDLLSAMKPAMDKEFTDYHNANIAPYAPTMQNVQSNVALHTAINAVKQMAPDLLEGQDPSLVGRMAIDFYQSTFNTGQDDLGRTQYALDQIRNLTKGAGGQPLPMSTGSGNQQPQYTAPAYNQVGRTQAGSEQNNPYGYPKGSTIRLKGVSINDVGGIDEYRQYAANMEALHQYNTQNNMGWSIVPE